MADTDYQAESVGQVYAQALVNLAAKQNVLAEITEDVRGLKALLDSNAQLAQFASAPSVDDAEKIASLIKIFDGRVHPLVLETLKAMAHRHRLVFLPGLFVAFEDILDRQAGRIDVEISSVKEIPAETVERIRAGIAKALGKDPRIKIKIDPTLIGGIRLRIEDTLIDGSVETQLGHLREQLERVGTSKLQQKLQAIVTA